MSKCFINFIKKNWLHLTIIAILCVIVGVLLFERYQENKTKFNFDEIEYIDSAMVYHKFYYDSKISSLKKENKQLYDSIKKCKDQITYLIQFKYEKEHSTGVVAVRDDEPETTPQTFEYTNEPNDTFAYDLKINAEKEPYWYSLNVKTSDKFTIINKKDQTTGLNEITIGGEGQGVVSDVTVFTKKEKKKLQDRIAVGPTVTFGINPFSGDIGIVAGFGATIDLW